MPCNFCRKKKKSSKVMEREFNIECLDEHNSLRSLHGCRPLIYNDKLAKTAQAFAEKLASSDRLEHSNAEDYGETLVSRYCTRDCNMTGKQAALVWYSEIENYDFNCENQLSCGNFSQVLWKSTHEAGFGIAKTADNHRIYAVGHYFPAGNYTNEWIENVPPPLDGKIYVPSKEELGVRESNNDSVKGEKDSESVYSIDSEALRELVFPEDEKNKEFEGNNYQDEKYNDGKVELAKFISMNNEEEKSDGIEKTTSRSSSYVESSYENKDISLEPIRLKQPEKSYMLWSRKTTGVGYNKKGKKIKFVRTIERYLKRDEDGNISVSDDITIMDTKTMKYLNDSEYLTIKQSGPDELIYEDLEEFRNDVHKLHNLYRKYYNAKPVTLDKELCDMAQKWAEKMLKEGKPYYSNERYNDLPLGENISYRNTFFDYISANDLMSVWEEEAENYDYSKEDNDVTQSGHFTQVIWKGTEKIGIGRVRCINLNKVYIVVYYYPPGNVVGQFRENLEPRNYLKSGINGHL